MPELPEVETVRRSLEPNIIGKTIECIEVRHPKITRFNKDFETVLKGKTITSLDRRAKLLMFRFSKWESVLTAHLKMTGQFFYEDKRGTIGGGHSYGTGDDDLPHAHTRVIIHFTDDTTLYFNDMRLFGYLRIVTPPELEEMLKSYGIEPGQPDFTRESFEEIFKKRKTLLKALLLNQKVIAGLGNIYVDEVCHFAKVRPMRKVSSLTRKERDTLFIGCNEIIERALEEGGTTFISFSDGNGKKGNFRDHLQVFGRQGKECPRCKKIIKKTVCAGRGTHYCPGCQK